MPHETTEAVDGERDGPKHEMRDDRNLAEGMRKDKREAIGKEARRLYLIDKSSRGAWEDARANYLDSFLCTYERSDFPYDNAPAPRVPFLTEGCAQFGARFYEAQMPAKGPVTVKAMGSEDEPRASRVLHHLNYQMQFESDLAEAMDYVGVQLPLDGSAFLCIDWDHDRRRHAIEAIPANELVVPFRYRGPIEDAPRASRILHRTPLQIRRLVKDGYFVKDGKDLPAPSVAAVEGAGGPLEEKARESDGVFRVESDDPSGARTLVQMHTHWDVFGDGDDIACIITFDLETGTLLRIESREYLDADGQTREFGHLVEFVFIPNPSSGTYGIGLGQLMQSLIEAADDSLKLLLVAGTYSSTSMGLVSDRSGIEKGDLDCAPGQFRAVEMNGDKISDHIYQFQFRGPDGVMYQLLGLMSEYAQRLSSVSDLMQGLAPRGSNTTATEVLSLTEQGLKLFSAVHKRGRRSLEKLFQKAALLNHMYLGDDKYSAVLGTDWEEYRFWQQQVAEYQQAQQVLMQVQQVGFAPPELMETIGPVLMNPPPENWASVDADYHGSDGGTGVDIVPAADPEIVSRTEKLALAEKTMQVVMQVPSAAQDPMALHEAGRRILMAMGIEDIDKVLPAPPPPPPPPPPMPQEEELAGLMEGKPMTVNEMDDHQAHLGAIQNFKALPYWQLLTPDMREHVEQHERAHAAHIYREQEAQQQNVGQVPQTAGGPALGPGPGAQPPGGAGLEGAVRNALSGPTVGTGEALDNAPASLLGRFGDQLRALSES